MKTRLSKVLTIGFMTAMVVGPFCLQWNNAGAIPTFTNDAGLFVRVYSDEWGTAKDPIVTTTATTDGGMGSYAAPIRSQSKALCLDVANKLGMTVILAPDAGSPQQNCIAVPPAIQKRMNATGRMCVKIGSVPTSCTDVAVSDGVRIGKDSPEDFVMSCTPTVIADGGTAADGSAETHCLLCALPNATSETTGVVIEITPYTDCGAVP